MVVGWSTTAWAVSPTKAQACETAKLTAVRKKEACLANDWTEEVKNKPSTMPGATLFSPWGSR
jgi:hypothetical protein